MRTLRATNGPDVPGSPPKAAHGMGVRQLRSRSAAWIAGARVMDDYDHLHRFEPLHSRFPPHLGEGAVIVGAILASVGVAVAILAISWIVALLTHPVATPAATWQWVS